MVMWYPDGNVYWFLLCLPWAVLADISVGVGSIGKPSSENEMKLIECQIGDTICVKDRVGFEAVAQLHSQIDDNQDGGLNRAESDEFIRDDLKHDGNTVNFHGTDDFITIYDLWQIWIKSNVYNWTTDDVVLWLEEHVELPQYAASFRSHNIDGRVLPRLASNYQALISTLGIKSPVHKQKLTVKATDVVLFGPPKSKHSYIKDLLLVTSLVVAAGGCYFAYVQHRRAQSHVSKLMTDLSSLQNSEDALSQLQQQLDQAQKAQRTVVDDKEALERKLRDEINSAKTEAERLRYQRETKEEEFSKLKLAEEELIQVRLALFEAERHLEERQLAPFANLQQWLQFTYEVETKYFDEKRIAAEKQLHAAKEMCEKIRRQKGKFLGSLRVAHTASLDETDNKILTVRTALEDIKVELHERTQRWKQIENICGFNITTNPGIPYLDSLLRGSTQGYTDGARSQSNFSSLDSTDDEVASVMQPRRVIGGSKQVLPNLMRAGMQLSLVGASFPGLRTCAPLPGMTILAQSDVRERKGMIGGMGSSASLLQPTVSQSVRATPSPSLRARAGKAQLAETSSMESLLHADTNVIFDLGGETGQDKDEEHHQTASVGLSKSCSVPVQMASIVTPKKSESHANSLCSDKRDSVPNGGNDSDSKHSSSDANGNEERKKKSAFSKLLSKTKQKSS